MTNRIAPNIAGLPTGPRLDALVRERTIAVYLEALADPELEGLDSDQLRTVVAGRVGLTLAFPATAPPAWP